MISTIQEKEVLGKMVARFVQRCLKENVKGWQKSRYFEYLILGAILTFSLCYSLSYYYHSGTPFFSLSCDDAHRTLLSFEVSKGDLLPYTGRAWPPLHYWLVGLVMRFYTDLYRTPMMVNLTFSTLGLILLYHFAKSLFNSREVGFMTVTLTALLPWHLWLSLSGLVEPIFHFFVILGFLACLWWIKTDQNGYLVGAALSFLASGMLRYEGWIFSVPFTLFLLGWGVIKCRRTSGMDYILIISAFIPWIFPIIWSTFYYLNYGDPFIFASVTREFYIKVHGPDSLLVGATRPLLDLIRISPLIFFLAIYGIISSWKRQPRATVLLGLLWLGEFCLKTVSSINGVITMNMPIRTVVINAILLVPYAAAAIHDIWERAGWGKVLATALSSLVYPGYRIRYISPQAWGKVLAAVLFLGICVANINDSSPRPQGLPSDAIQVGQYINMLWDKGVFAPSDRVMVEMILWDFVNLQLMSGHPDRILFDRRFEPKFVNGAAVLDDKTNPSLLSQDTVELRDYFKRNNVRAVILYSEPAAKRVQQIMQQVYKSGRFTIYALLE